MFKNVEAFFKQKKDAESAKAVLQGLNVDNEVIEVIPSEVNLASVVPIENNGSLVGSTSFLDVLDPTNNEVFADKKYLTHRLQFKVKEEEYKQALSVIQNHEGYMDESKI